MALPLPLTGDYPTVGVSVLCPLLRNSLVMLNAPTPIKLNYFSHDPDVVAPREGLRFIQDILLTGDANKHLVKVDLPRPCHATTTTSCTS